jgi:hypothetical protein
MSDNQYEFSPEQNSILLDLANKMKFVGIFEIVLGGIYVLTAVGGMFQNIGSGIVQVFLGYLTLNASKFFLNIVQTEGNDITHLMSAMLELKKLYSIQFWLNIILIVFVVIGLILGAFGLAALATGKV